MKRVSLVIIFTLLFFISVLPAYSGPIAQFTAPVVMFEPVAEGTPIEHSFTVKNKGDELLQIKKVEPG